MIFQYILLPLILDADKEYIAFISTQCHSAIIKPLNKESADGLGSEKGEGGCQECRRKLKEKEQMRI